MKTCAKQIKKVLALVCALAVLVSAFSGLSVLAINSQTSGLIASSGFEVGKLIAKLDPTNSLTEGWTLHSHSSIVTSPENDGTKTVRLDNTNGDHNYADVAANFVADNFVVEVVIGSDSNSTKADGNPYIAINDTDESGTVVSTEMFGFSHKNRDATKTPAPGKYFYKMQGNATYYQPKDVVFDDDGYTKITLTVYRYNGKYYYYANGELIHEYVSTGEQTGKVTLNIADTYSFAYVHSASVYEISVPGDNNGLVEESGFVATNIVSEVDFTSLKLGSVASHDGWALSNVSVVEAVDGVGKTAKFQGRSSSASATKVFTEDNFALVTTFGSNSNDADARKEPTILITTRDASGATIEANKFGFGQKFSDHPGEFFYSYSSYYPYRDGFEFEDDGYTLITLTVYRFDGKYYFYANGNLIGDFSIDMTNAASTEIFIYDGWSNVYVDKIAVYDIEQDVDEPIQAPEGLISSSGFITGDVIESIDFSNMNTGDITENGNWTFTKATVEKALEGKANALRLIDSHSATAVIDQKNFVAVAVFGTDSKNTNADGYPSFAVNGKNAAGEVKPAVSTSFGQKYRTGRTDVNAGETMVVDGFYNYGENFEFDEDGYTLVTVTMYLYDNVYYCYCNGMYLGTYANCTGVSTEDYRDITITSNWSDVYLHSVTVYDIIPANFTVDGAVYVDGGLDVTLTLNQSKKGDFDMSEAQYGAVVTLKDGSTPEHTTVETEGAALASFTVTNDGIVKFNHFVAADTNKYVNVRPYICLDDTYYYSAPKILSVKSLSAIAKGENTKKITFTAFSDFHYMKNQETGIICRSDVSDLISILNRAEQTNSSFVMQCGDFVKDAKVSSEIFEAYHTYKKENGEIMPVYGIYGNHDLEQGNAMTTINPTLTNDTKTVWGTDSGKMEVDSRIAYYYVDYDGFRFIYLDNNYSFNPTTGEWVRNLDGSYSYPSGNTMGYSLGPVQMEWLQNVLTDAGKKDMTCVISTHAALTNKISDGGLGDSPQTVEMIKEINNTYPGTVVLALSGHTHNNQIFEEDGIVWMSIQNTMANLNTNDSLCTKTGIYSDDMTVRKELYDNEGNFLGFAAFALNKLEFNDMTYFCEDPLSAVITISENGDVFINGNESEWAYGIEPAEDCLNGLKYKLRGTFTPYISDYSTVNCELVGHIFNESDECGCCGKYVFKNSDGFGYDYIKVAENVVDNAAYLVKIKYKSSQNKAIGLLTAETDNIFVNQGFIGEMGKVVLNLESSNEIKEAQAFITIDKFGSTKNAQGNALYLYADDLEGLEIESITLSKLTDESGGALLGNKGVSILKDQPQNAHQAMRFYFSYDTIDGSSMLIDGKEYKVKSRGFLIANGNVAGENSITRETAKTSDIKIIDMNVSKNLNSCWQVTQNSWGTENLWYSIHVVGFESENGSYNASDRLYVKGYIVIETEYGESTLYTGESNVTVKDVASLLTY